MPSYITVEEFKTDNPTVDVSQYADTTVSGFITKASKKVDEFVEYTFGQETITDELTEGYINEDLSFTAFPRKIPINNLTSYKIVKGPTEITINLTNGAGTNIFNIPTSKDRAIIPTFDITLSTVSLIDLRSLLNTDFFAKISYTAGEASVPESVKDATSLYVMDILGRRQNPGGATRVQQGGISISYGGQRSGKSDLVKDAELLLTKFKRVSGF